jgi:AGZA family xanthine/uracil permease-like MFS transporter
MGGFDYELETIPFFKSPAFDVFRDSKVFSCQAGMGESTLLDAIFHDMQGGINVDRLFELKKHGTSMGTEILAGLTTFVTMVNIIFVNPNILSTTGMPWQGVFLATIIATATGTLVMGLFANVPYALAPGMGLNAFFTFTVCSAFGFRWQEALALVFLCGLINVAITVTKVRKQIIRSIPSSLQHAISGGIGVFIAYIGIKEAGFLKFTSEAPNILAAWTKSGSPDPMPATEIAGHLGGVVTNGNIIPALANFSSPGAIVALAGLFLIIILMVLRVKGSILIGVLGATVTGIPLGVVSPSSVSFNPESWSKALADLGITCGALFGNPGFGSLFSDPARVPLVIITIFAFSLSDTFDTIGTFIGTGRATGIFSDVDIKALEDSPGFKSKMDKALFADSIATSIGAIFGTSNTTTYIESAAGIKAGGKTGLAAVVTAFLFLLCIVLAPIAGLVPAFATAPALIVVGILMMGSFRKIAWDDFDEAVPAFFAAIFMAVCYNISYGIAASFIFYCLIKVIRGKFREIHVILYSASILFLLNFVITAMMKI